MSSAFAVYLELGFRHIADLAGYDHILFVVALSAGYSLAQWRQLLVLVTAFTVGHSLTLALATLQVVQVSSAWVEFLIPVTIVLTGLYSLRETRRPPATEAGPSGTAPPLGARGVKYGMALFFGLIHGLGFSNFLRAILGEEESLVWPLFSFNVGLEVGQLAILAVILAVGWAATRGAGLSPVAWTRVLSVAAVGPALFLVAGRIPWAG